MASTAAFVPGPLMATYYASKAYVLSFSQALSEELRGTGITVTCLCPGPIRTNFVNEAKMHQSKLFKSLLMDAPAVAKTGYEAMMEGKMLSIPGWQNKLTVFGSRLIPRVLLPRIIKYAQAPTS